MMVDVYKTVVNNKLIVSPDRSAGERTGQQRPAAQNARKDVPAEVQEMEDQLRRYLGTRIKLRYGKDGGSLTIYYFSDEELKDMMPKISRSKGCAFCITPESTPRPHPSRLPPRWHRPRPHCAIGSDQESWALPGKAPKSKIWAANHLARADRRAHPPAALFALQMVDCETPHPAECLRRVAEKARASFPPR
jgi:hypothetical protein